MVADVGFSSVFHQSLGPKVIPLSFFNFVMLGCFLDAYLKVRSTTFFNDRFYLSFFVATYGFRESDFDYY